MAPAPTRINGQLRRAGSELQRRLGLAQQSSAPASPQIIAAANPQAFEAYLQGRQLINRRGKDNLEKAVAHLERSLRLDSDFAPAHAQLAIATILLLRSPTTYGDLTLTQVEAQAVPHIERAIALVPSLAEAYGARTVLALVKQDFDAAVRHAERAIEINPSYIDAMVWLKFGYSQIGRHVESLRAEETLMRLDPASVNGRINYVRTLGTTGRIEEARSLARELAKTHPWAGHISFGDVLVEATGDLAEGIEMMLRAHALEPDDQLGNSVLAFGFGWLGLETEALRISDHVAYDAHFSSRNYDAAINAANANRAIDLDNPSPVFQLATALHRAGRVEQGSVHFEQLLESQPRGLLIDPFLADAMPTLRLAYARHVRGDQAGAEQLVENVMRDLEARRSAGMSMHVMATTEAMIAALHDDTAAAIAALGRAVELGLRDRGVFDEPVFAPVLNDPALIAVRKQLDAILADEREKTLQLICHNNPVPDSWQPHPDTC